MFSLKSLSQIQSVFLIFPRVNWMSISVILQVAYKHFMLINNGTTIVSAGLRRHPDYKGKVVTEPFHAVVNEDMFKRFPEVTAVEFSLRDMPMFDKPDSRRGRLFQKLVRQYYRTINGWIIT